MARIDYDALIASDEYQGSLEFKPIWALGNLVRASVLQVELGVEGATSVGFLNVNQDPESDLDGTTLAKAILAAEQSRLTSVDPLFDDLGERLGKWEHGAPESKPDTTAQAG